MQLHRDANATGLSRDRQTGRAAVGTLVEALVVVAVVPPIVCCLLQAAVSLAGIVLPWIAIAMIMAALGACLAAAVTARRLPPPHEQPLPPPALPPIRRPPGIPERRSHDPH